MYDKLVSFFKEDFAQIHFANVMAEIANLVEMFSEDYLKDQNARDAAIDLLTQIINQHKSNQSK